MTKHPGRTPAQRRVLDAIGCGNNSPIMAKRTKEAMLREGLIREAGTQQIRDRLGVLSITVYEMPIPVHIQWCSAMAEQVDGAEAD